MPSDGADASGMSEGGPSIDGDETPDLVFWNDGERTRMLLRIYDDGPSMLVLLDQVGMPSIMPHTLDDGWPLQGEHIP